MQQKHSIEEIIRQKEKCRPVLEILSHKTGECTYLAVLAKDKVWYIDKIDEQDSFIERNDGEFKKRLDEYKYHVRFQDGTYSDYQKAVGEILATYDLILANSNFLCGEKIRLVDMALLPFIRQCAHVDLDWFNDHFPFLSKWMEEFKTSDLFLSIMKKYDVWESQTDGVIVDWNKLQK